MLEVEEQGRKEEVFDGVNKGEDEVVQDLKEPSMLISFMVTSSSSSVDFLALIYTS